MLNILVPFLINIAIIVIIFRFIGGKIESANQAKKSMIDAENLQDRFKGFTTPIFKFIGITYFSIIFISLGIGLVGTAFEPELRQLVLENEDGAMILIFALIAIVIVFASLARQIFGSKKEKNKETMLLTILKRNSKDPTVLEAMKKFKKITQLKKLADINDQVDLLTIYHDNSEHWYRARIAGTGANQHITKLTRYS